MQRPPEGLHGASAAVPFQAILVAHLSDNLVDRSDLRDRRAALAERE
ncbi:MAG: hypothetical protein ACI82G_003315, partial [Bradymonadia bacterium]